MIPKLECLRCGHQWMQRTEKPKACSSCRTKLWEKPKPKNSKPRRHKRVSVYYETCREDWGAIENKLLAEMKVTDPKFTVGDSGMMLGSGKIVGGRDMELERILPDTLKHFLSGLKESGATKTSAGEA